MRDTDSWDDLQGAEAYAECVRGGAVYRTLARRLVELAGISAGQRVLDLATGTGIVASLAIARQARVVGLDHALAMLRVARSELPLDDVSFLRADPARLPLADASFDAVTCSAALWHFPALGTVWRDVHRALRPGGTCAFNVPVDQLEARGAAAAVPFQTVLADEGIQRFGAPPAPVALRRTREQFVEDALAAGFSLEHEANFLVGASQQELIDLMRVPAFKGRLYPQASEAELDAWIDAAAARVDPAENVEIAWCEYLLRRPL